MTDSFTKHTFTMTEKQAGMIHALADSHMKALHNWIASAVERGEDIRAKELVAELREHQRIFAGFNVRAWHDIADATGNPLETSHNLK